MMIVKTTANDIFMKLKCPNSYIKSQAKIFSWFITKWIANICFSWLDFLNIIFYFSFGLTLFWEVILSSIYFWSVNVSIYFLVTKQQSTFINSLLNCTMNFFWICNNSLTSIVSGSKYHRFSGHQSYRNHTLDFALTIFNVLNLSHLPKDDCIAF